MTLLTRSCPIRGMRVLFAGWFDDTLSKSQDFSRYLIPSSSSTTSSLVTIVTTLTFIDYPTHCLYFCLSVSLPLQGPSLSSVSRQCVCNPNDQAHQSLWWHAFPTQIIIISNTFSTPPLTPESHRRRWWGTGREQTRTCVMPVLVPRVSPE